MDHRTILAGLIEQEKDYLFASFTNEITHAGKLEKWISIRNKAVAAGAVQYAQRTPEQMRKIWGDFKKEALRKNDLSKKTGHGRVILTKVEQRVFSVVNWQF